MIDLDKRPTTGIHCRADHCDGNPLSATSGWHLVTAIIEGDRFRGPSCFVCTTHLPEAERVMVEHMQPEARRWEVETYRMSGWEDDGRGPVYTVAAGGGDETLF